MRTQFMAPEDMAHPVNKVVTAGNRRVSLTERGASFGYQNLVVDMRALPVMRQFAPMLFGVTHSVQTPGGLGSTSGANRCYGPYLARAAAAAGVDGFFMETHPDPLRAWNDGPAMIPLDDVPGLIESLLTVWKAARPYWS
jgi:2-dehydro-3-deoxyphosphooctonate aldolase (KDO 8-P synthase)